MLAVPFHCLSLFFIGCHYWSVHFTLQCDNHEIRPGKYLGVCISVANNRLFVGSIPKNKTRESILEDFGKVTGQCPDLRGSVVDGLLHEVERWFHLPEGLQEVILYHQPDDKKKNRGFCFLEYEDHKSAAQARRRLMSGKVKVWGNPVTVEWADPVAEPDPEVMAKVSMTYCFSSFSLFFFLLIFICFKRWQSFSVAASHHCPLCAGEGAVCKEAGHSSHWRTSRKDFLSVWEAGTSEKTERLRICPFWRKGCCCQGGCSTRSLPSLRESVNITVVIRPPTPSGYGWDERKGARGGGNRDRPG